MGCRQAQGARFIHRTLLPAQMALAFLSPSCPSPPSPRSRQAGRAGVSPCSPPPQTLGCLGRHIWMPCADQDPAPPPGGQCSGQASRPHLQLPE